MWQAINNKDKKPLPPQADTDVELSNFTRGNGKCRDARGNFDTSHSYFPTGPTDPRDDSVKHRVRDIKGC